MSGAAPRQGAGGGVRPQVGGQPQASNPQVGSGATDPSASPQAGGEGGQETDPNAVPEAVSPEVAAEIRRENQALRNRLHQQEEAARKAEEEARAKELAAADSDKLRSEITRLQQELQTERDRGKAERVKSRIMGEAAKLGVVDTDAAAKLLDMSAVSYDSDGNPTNAESLLRDLIKARPWLRGVAAAQGSQNGGAQSVRPAKGSGSEMNALLRAAAGRGQR